VHIHARARLDWHNCPWRVFGTYLAAIALRPTNINPSTPSQGSFAQKAMRQAQLLSTPWIRTKTSPGLLKCSANIWKFILWAAGDGVKKMQKADEEWRMRYKVSD
jgi:hypothetical protein